MELTPYQIAELRLKCLEPFVKTASLHSLDKGEIYEHAEKTYKFITQPLSENKAKAENPVKGSAKPK